MGGRHLPQGYVETGRWSLKQATPADIELLIRNRRRPTAMPIALLILPASWAGRRPGCDIGGGTLSLEVVPGAVNGESYCTSWSTASSSSQVR